MTSTDQLPNHNSKNSNNSHSNSSINIDNKDINSLPILNIAAYKFITLENLEELRTELKEKCVSLLLKGTILVSPEGINLFLAGTQEQINDFLLFLRAKTPFVDLEVKESLSEKQPFNRMNVRLKKEIITMKHPLIQPEKGRAPHVDAHTLKRWLDQGHDDENREVVMLDTRNDFEVEVGTFDNAIDYNTVCFSEFPELVKNDLERLKDKTVVSFCTGGIRCEKAAIYMKEVGYDHVYQLEGGILKYFEEVKGAHYHGDCFVFDHRVALDPELKPTNIAQCFACRRILSYEEQQHELYQPPKQCQYCLKNMK